MPEGERRAPALDDAGLASLVALATKVEAARGPAQDVEWAMDASGALLLLQARPITTLTLGRESILDNANIVESYPGLSTPSPSRSRAPATRRRSASSSGASACRERMLAKNARIYENLVAYVDGRIYYHSSPGTGSSRPCRASRGPGRMGESAGH